MTPPMTPLEARLHKMKVQILVAERNLAQLKEAAQTLTALARRDDEEVPTYISLVQGECDEITEAMEEVREHASFLANPNGVVDTPMAAFLQDHIAEHNRMGARLYNVLAKSREDGESLRDYLSRHRCGVAFSKRYVNCGPKTAKLFRETLEGLGIQADFIR